ncbi:MAG: dephospho-CoA kinase [Spirochaetales bacterium]|nr:dephospho-CoA kinase [Spirochaetales bacterium]
MIIGLTGKSCSGKNYVASLFGDEFFVIDEDKLGHEALDNNIDKLREAFGEGILTEGRVDRKKLGPIVFSDKEKLEKLNSISHPWMVNETLRLSKEAEEKGKIAVINAAILEKMGFVPYCNEVILVSSPYSERLKRAMERDKITPEAFAKRSESQSEIGSTLSGAGIKVTTIVNDGDKESLSRQVKAYCDSILGKRSQ